MADVVIVGAGIIGSSIALALQERGVSTLLLERAVPGAESSSAAAGMLAPHLEAHGPDAPYALGVESLARYPGWAERIKTLSGLDTGYQRDGAVRLLTEANADDAEREIAWQIERDVPIERLDRRALERLVPGVATRFDAGLFFPREAQVDPRRLMRALSAATEQAGAEHLSGVTVRSILAEDGHATGVELDDRVLRATRIVVAAGAWTSLIPGSSLPKEAVKPARGQVVSLDAKKRPFAPFIWTEGGYLVPRPDGRVLVGATVELVGYDKSVTAGGVRRLLGAAIDSFPALAEARLVETWAGLRPFTSGDHPLIGETGIEGLYMATGHYRNGILQAPMTAELIADLVTGRTPALDPAPFAPATRS